MKSSGIQLNKLELKKVFSRHWNDSGAVVFYGDEKDRSIFLLLLLLLCYNQTKHILQNLHDSFVIYILRTTD